MGKAKAKVSVEELGRSLSKAAGETLAQIKRDAKAPAFPDTLKFSATKVNIRTNSKGSYIQFTLIMEFGDDEAACEWRNCLCGIGKNGPWAMPSQHKYKPSVWNKAFSERIIESFRESGWLGKIENSKMKWAETEDVTVQWRSK